MNERFEWIEPEEAARERCAEKRRALPWLWDFGSGLVLLLGAAAALVSPLFHQDPLSLSLRSLQFSFGGVFSLGWLFWLQVGDSPSTYALDEEAVTAKLSRISYKYLWSQVRSFNFADHATSPGVRSLLIHHQNTPHKLQLDIDKAALGAFIESRIAEQRAQRLMRRVRRKL